MFRSGVGSESQGMFMENGSGGHLQDLVFEGGKLGMWVGNQQFTSRNITITDTSQAAVIVYWDWAWTFVGLHIARSPVGVQVFEGVGSVTIVDSDFTDVGACVTTGFNASKNIDNTLVLDNIAVSGPAGVLKVVMNANTVVLQRQGPAATVDSFIQGSVRP